MRKLFLPLLLCCSALANEALLDKQLDKFYDATKGIVEKTVYTPRYSVKKHERVLIVKSFNTLRPHIDTGSDDIKSLKRLLRQRKNAQALKIIKKHTKTYSSSLEFLNYMMLGGENFVAALSDDFEEINYDAKTFIKLLKRTKKEIYNSRARVRNSGHGGRRSSFRNSYTLKNIQSPRLADFHLLRNEIQNLDDGASADIIAEINQNIDDGISQIKSFRQLLKETQWKASNYGILYNLKVFILKSLSYVSMPMKHKIQKNHLEQVANKEFEPGDIGAIQRYGKLSNIVFKGNWTHGLMYIGKHSKFESYFNEDAETNKVFKMKCISEGINCNDFMGYLGVRYPERIKKYKASENNGKPLVTIEGLKPGVVFMELGPSMAWDNLVILRPNLSKKDKALAIERAFGSLGKKYDYDFNGNSYTRFVCTELIQYAYEENKLEDKKGIDWDVNLVFGKPAMYGFDLVKTYINDIESENPTNKLDLVIYMKGMKKKEIKNSATTPEFGTARRGTISELKDTL